MRARVHACMHAWVRAWVCVCVSWRFYGILTNWEPSNLNLPSLGTHTTKIKFRTEYGFWSSGSELFSSESTAISLIDLELSEITIVVLADGCILSKPPRPPKMLSKAASRAAGALQHPVIGKAIDDHLPVVSIVVPFWGCLIGS